MNPITPIKPMYEAYCRSAVRALITPVKPIYEAYCRSAVRMQCNPAPMIGGLAIVACIVISGSLVAAHLAQVLEAIRIGAAITCCLLGTAIVALTLRHVNKSTCKARAGVPVTAAVHAHAAAVLAVDPDPPGDTAPPAISDPAGEATVATVHGGTDASPAGPADADEIAAWADHLRGDGVVLLSAPDNSVIQRVKP